MAVIHESSTELRTLKAMSSGAVASPTDSGYDEARAAWNLAADQRPAAVAIPENESDIAFAVAYAREAGLRVSVQGTGHNPMPLGDMSGSILIRTHRMRQVDVDPTARRARVQAGAIWSDVTVPASAHGLAPLSGSSPDVGVVGYSLGGGVGYLGRKHGIATNSVTAIELVTADGRLRRVDAEHHPDLFWALRGGGGNFGVVTAMEFRVYPVEELYAGMMLWPVEDSARIFKAWRDWTETAPDEVTSMARMIQFPPFPDVPEPLRGRHMMVLSAAFVGSAEGGAEVLQPLRDLGPEMDMFGPMPIEGLMRLHGDPEEPMAFSSDHAMIDALPDEAIDTIVAQAGAGTGSPLLMVEIRQMGGAMGRVPEGAGALDRIDGRFLAFTGGLHMAPGDPDRVAGAARDLMAALAPYSHGRTYLNFAERVTNTRSAYSVETHQRLQAVKGRYDSEGLLHGNHRIEATAS